MADRVRVAAVGEFPSGSSRVVDVGGTLVAVFHADGKFYAIDDRCPHAGASLADGCVEDGVVTCAWHAWRFRLSDGAWADNPRVRTKTFPVVVEEGVVFVEAGG